MPEGSASGHSDIEPPPWFQYIGSVDFRMLVAVNRANGSPCIYGELEDDGDE